MKKFLILQVCLFLFLSSQAMAAYWADVEKGQNYFPEVSVTITPTAGTPSTHFPGAGVFDIDFKLSAGDATLFSRQGFCVEPGVDFGDGWVTFTPVNLYSPTDAVKAENMKKAAWLMNQYWDPSYIANDMLKQYAGLQLAIWDAVMPELSVNPWFDPLAPVPPPETSYQFYDLYYTDLTLALTDGRFNSFSPVNYRVLEISDGREEYQDMIVYKPIPEPTTMLLFGFGLLGIGAIGRRKS